MLKVMVDIAETLDVPMIAEGVETKEQMLALRELGCDIVQGYYFSRPVPPEEFETFLK
jgi:EAL domain-containing protein (putative c-di-GMP-specific phosphodiesterase class I)